MLGLWYKGTVSRVVLSKSSELASTKVLYLFVIAFPLFLASSVCIMQCNAFYSIFRTMCNYRSVPCACVPVSQTSFGHISINSSSILTVSMATESP